MQLAVGAQLCAIVREALYQERHKTPVQTANPLQVQKEISTQGQDFTMYVSARDLAALAWAACNRTFCCNATATCLPSGPAKSMQCICDLQTAAPPGTLTFFRTLVAIS